MTVSHEIARWPNDLTSTDKLVEHRIGAPDDVLSGILIGRSLAIRRVRSRIMQLARTTLPVLIDGPTGSGKELVAQSLHDLSGRIGRLVSFNVAAIGESMFEDALFGHVRGAFTGAAADMPGFLLEADHGTVFLDEISTLSISLQGKLLRALETREFRPVGGRSDQRSDFRLIAATNEDLSSLAACGRFRRDLLYRIRAAVIRMPSLRERAEDIRILAGHFARAAASPSGEWPVPDEPFSEGAVQLLEAHTWMGNVRELRHVVQLALVLSDRRQAVGVVEVEEALRDVGGASAERTERDTDREADRDRLLDALERCDGDAQRAANSIGISKSHLYRRMRDLGIAPRGRRAAQGRPASEVRTPTDGNCA
jgi:DNA-binding NtrC family response regulator